MVKGLGTVICHVTDLDRAKAWYSSAFGLTPYFDQPFYVGFNIGGYELGLDPDPGSGRSGASAVQGIGEGIKWRRSPMPLATSSACSRIRASGYPALDMS
jgi:catechol 2,3-dioxygenase-like lactoylglutathione lyase family enzyme